jgi:hypothetical protein
MISVHLLQNGLNGKRNEGNIRHKEGRFGVSGGGVAAIVVLLLLEFQARFLSPTLAASDFSSSEQVFSGRKSETLEKNLR